MISKATNLTRWSVEKVLDRRSWSPEPTRSAAEAKTRECSPTSQRAPVSTRMARARRGMRSDSMLSRDRKSTRLNSSHLGISYAGFCLKKEDDGEEFRPEAVAGDTGGAAVGGLCRG